MTGILLRLAGPLQSWGEHSMFGERDTASFPTRSGLVGLLASALGRARTEPIDDLARLRLTIRIDRPGRRIVDFHTIGGGLPRQLTPPTADGKRRAENATTIVSRRHYLADAVFVVAVSGPDALVSHVAEALHSPTWAPYLGRRSCPPEQPLVLAGPIDDPERELSRVPLALPRLRGPIDFVYDQSGAGEMPTGARTEVADLPVSFAPDARAYRTQPRWVVPVELPAGLCAGTGRHYLKRLHQYLHGDS